MPWRNDCLFFQRPCSAWSHATVHKPRRTLTECALAKISMSVHLQKSAPMQPRPSPLKICVRVPSPAAMAAIGVLPQNPGSGQRSTCCARASSRALASRGSRSGSRSGRGRKEQSPRLCLFQLQFYKFYRFSSTSSVALQS